MEEPSEGGYCNVVSDLVCSYNECFDVDEVQARCVDYAWEIVRASCNPPFPLEGGIPDSGAVDADGAPPIDAAAGDGEASSDGGAQDAGVSDADGNFSP